MGRIDGLYWNVVSRVDHSINESIEYSLPQIPILGFVGLIGFPVFYWIWHEVFPQPYDNIALNLLGCVLSAVLIPLHKSRSKQTWQRKLFWIFVFTFELSFFFTFMLLMNNCNMVWTMSTMAGLMLLVLIAHDWLLATLMHIGGSVVAFLVYMVTASTAIELDLYIIQIPIYLFVVIAGGLFNYQSATFRQARLKALASVGAELAHELRTPLLVIDYHSKKISQNSYGHSVDAHKTNSFNIDSENSPMTHNEYVQLIRREVKHANTIIDMFLLDLGSKNIYEQKFANYSAKSVVEKAIERYPFASEMERRKVSCSVDLDFNYYGSDLLLTHVLFNLIKNALAHLDHHGRIHISTTTGIAGNSIEVLDSGSGIATSKQAYIFDEFYTLDSSSGGTGIGLAFCKKVMCHFKGKIECESELGRYTLFRLAFPSVRGNPRSIGKSILAPLLTQLEGDSILVVDNSLGHLKALHELFPSGELNVTWATDIASAFLHLKTAHFDALVINSEGGSEGCVDSVRAIRNGKFFKENQCSNHKKLPIIVVGINIDSDTRIAMLDAGVCVFPCDVTKTDTKTYLDALCRCMESAKEIAPNSTMGRNLVGKAVLIVDDHEINYHHTRAQLTPFNIKTHHAVDGVCAMRLLDENHYDAILMDLHMPGDNGWEITEQIRLGKNFTTFKQFRSIPIIGLSGDPRSELLPRCLRSGFNTLLLKPVDQSLLFKTLVEQVNHPTKESGASVDIPDKSESFSVLHLEPEAKFLHDILTPLLIIENDNSFLKETITDLIECGPNDNHFAANTKAHLALSQIACDIEKQISLIRIRIKAFWCEVRVIADPKELTRLRESIVREIEKLWNGIENALSTGIITSLPEFLHEYQTKLLHAPVLKKLPQKTLQELYTVKDRFEKEINTGRGLIEVYCKAGNITHKRFVNAVSTVD